jgi:hypothetical protein
MLQALAAQNRQGGPLGSGSVSRGLPLGEGPRLLGRMTLAPRPKGGRGRLTHYRPLGRVGESPPPGERSARLGEAGSRLAWTYAYAGGLLLALVSTLFLEYNEPNKQHGALFYEICCAAYPLVLVGVARGSRLRWPATTVAGIFMAVRLAMTWLLPLFPATPKLAPIYNPVRHLWPPFFPELLIVPAVALDLLLRRAGRPGGALASRDDAGRPVGRAALALAVGAVFFALLLAAQWSFSELLLSPYARNWFFAADQWTYRAHPGAWRYRYWLEGDAFGPRAAALSLLLAAASARLSLAWGGWLSRVRR